MPGAEEFGGEGFSFGGAGDKGGDEEREKDGPIGLSKLGSSSTAELHPKIAGGNHSGAGKQMPPASVMTRLILIMVWRKLIRNPQHLLQHHWPSLVSNLIPVSQSHNVFFIF